MSSGGTVGRAGIIAADSAIRPYIRTTPVVTVSTSDLGGERIGAPIMLKLELLQQSGSFKVRGAFANLLLRDIPEAGVVAASGGNHGAAVAYAAGRLGLKARIFVPEVSSQAKVDRIGSYGADLVVIGERYADALQASEEWAAASGALPIHAFDQVETLHGAGTLAQELGQQAPDIDTVVVAVGGGGLIGGTATWFQDNKRIVGAEPELAPTLTEALKAGHPVDARADGLAADSLAPRQVGQLMFPIAQRYVDQVVLVADEAIRDAQELLWRVLRIVVEPGGAAALAALLTGAYRPGPDERVAVVLSGGNTVAVDFSRQQHVD